MYFEDLVVGQTFSTEEVTVTRQAIVAFAAKYDPQPIHIDEEFAAEGPFATLIASGMHTLSMAWGAWIRTGLLGEHSQGGLGLQNVRFHDAVRAGDVLQTLVTVGDLKLTSRGRGLCRLDFDVVRTAGNRALTFETHFLLERRSAASTPPLLGP